MTDEEIPRPEARRARPAEGVRGLQGGGRAPGQPTVILAKTVKGYGLGEAGEGRNITHQQKKMNEDELREFRDRFNIPVFDDEHQDVPFYRPPSRQPRDEVPAGAARGARRLLPERVVHAKPLATRRARVLRRVLQGQRRGARSRRPWRSSAFWRICCKDKDFGKLVVPIIPDEARTFGMEALFRAVRHLLPRRASSTSRWTASSSSTTWRRRTARSSRRASPRPARMSSFIAAGTAYATHGVTDDAVLHLLLDVRVPAHRRPDLGGGRHARARLPARRHGGAHHAQRRGLQHQDGHSHLLASTVPNLMVLRPGVCLRDRRDRPGRHEAHVREAGGRCSTTSRSATRTTTSRRCPKGVEDGILRGAVRLSRAPAGHKRRPQILALQRRERALKAQEMLGEKYDVAPTCGARRATSDCVRTRWRRSAGTCCTPARRSEEELPGACSRRGRARSWP